MFLFIKNEHDYLRLMGHHVGKLLSNDSDEGLRNLFKLYLLLLFKPDIV